MRGFDHATILSPSFHGLRKKRLAQWPAFCVLNYEKKIPGGGGPEKLGGGVRHASWNPYPISDQNNNNNNNNIFISYIKYTNITPPANSKANRGRWCVDGLRFITKSWSEKDPYL